MMFDCEKVCQMKTQLVSSTHMLIQSYRGFQISQEFSFFCNNDGNKHELAHSNQIESYSEVAS